MARGEGSGGFGLWGLGRRIIGFLCFMICVGPILIIIGITTLTTSITDSRGENISSYNSVVADWNNQYRAEFENLVFSMNLEYMTLDLKIDTSVEPKLEVDSAIHKYTPLKYSLPLSSILESPTYFRPLSSTFRFSENNSNPIIRTVSVMDYDNYTASALNCYYSHDDESNCINACQTKSGIWDSDRRVCYVREYLNDYCLKVSRQGSYWAVDRSYGAEGCYNYRFAPETMQRLRTSDTGNNVYFDGLVTIRSAHDPYVYAAYLTGNTFSFGLTRAAKVVAGIVLIAVGGTILLPMIMVIWCLRRRHYQRHYHHHHETVVYQPGPVVYQQPAYAPYQQPPPPGAYQPQYQQPPSY